MTLTLKSLSFFSFFSSAAFISSLCFQLLVSFFSLLHVVCLLPQLLFLIWTLPYFVSLYSFLPKCFRLLLLFLYATKVPFDLWVQICFNFWETPAATSNLQCFQGFFFSFSLLYVVDVSSVHLHPHFAPVTNTSSLHLPLFICFYWFLQSDLSMVIMVFDFCSIMKHVERKTFLDDVKVVVSK